MNLCGPSASVFADSFRSVFLRTAAAGAHFIDRTVEADRFDLYTDKLLQLMKQSIGHARLCTTIHSCVDRVPIAKPLRQTALFQPCSATYRIALVTCRFLILTLSRCTGKKQFDAAQLVGSNFHAA
jgi:hypothetical protein